MTASPTNELLRIGMTLSAGVWGYVLQMVPAKLLLTLGLALVRHGEPQSLP